MKTTQPKKKQEPVKEELKVPLKDEKYISWLELYGQK